MNTSEVLQGLFNVQRVMFTPCRHDITRRDTFSMNSFNTSVQFLKNNCLLNFIISQLKTTTKNS